MSTLMLKIIAVVSMLIDHIGYAIGQKGFLAMGLPDGYWLCRAVGRLALPIFAFLIANGFRHTRSVPKYALRLGIFAVISEIPFDLFTVGKISIIEFNGMLPDIKLDNVFFTLLLGLIFLWLNDTYKKNFSKIARLLSSLTFVFIALFAMFISADYGMIGVALVALFGIINVEEKEKLPKLFVGLAVIAYWRMIARCILVAVYRAIGINLLKVPVLSYLFVGYNPIMSLVQTASILALGFILFYNGKSGKFKNSAVNTVVKYGFYAFYPLHLLALWFFI